MKPLTKSLVAGTFAIAALATATTALADGNGRRWWRPNHPNHPPRTKPGPAIPEPTAALAFGLGLAAVGIATRKRENR
jgi:hypothetical protein